MRLNPRHYFPLYIVAAIVLPMVPYLHWPLSWLETYFHEISHGLAALISGGSIARLELNFNGSGQCLTRGGYAPLISFAGYAGAVIWGAIIFYSARLSGKSSRWLSILVLSLILFSALLWVRDLTSIVIVAVISAVLYLSFRYVIGQWFPRFMEFAGVFMMVSATRAPTYLLDGKQVGDGANLAKQTHIPEFFWIAIWIIIALLSLFLVWRLQQRHNY